jgi:hypothetical protein
MESDLEFFKVGRVSLDEYSLSACHRLTRLELAAGSSVARTSLVGSMLEVLRYGGVGREGFG